MLKYSQRDSRSTNHHFDNLQPITRQCQMASCFYLLCLALMPNNFSPLPHSHPATTHHPNPIALPSLQHFNSRFSHPNPFFSLFSESDSSESDDDEDNTKLDLSFPPSRDLVSCLSRVSPPFSHSLSHLL
jgi:hypothetical protein